MSLHKIGTTYQRNSKQGGGNYTVVGHVNCERCNTMLEQLEVLRPSNAQRKKGAYYASYHWCHKCGLYTPDDSTYTRIPKNITITTK